MVDSRSFTKLIQICQSNSTKLCQISKNQDRIKAMLNEQKRQMAEILLKLEHHENNSEIETKFYQV